MRILCIDEAARDVIRGVEQHAAAHHYHPGVTRTIPGDDPAFVAHVQDGYRCVFTYTRFPHGLCRHLSVSVSGTLYPSPLAVFTLATEFGFTGWTPGQDVPPAHWGVAVNKAERCVVVAEPIGEPNT